MNTAVRSESYVADRSRGIGGGICAVTRTHNGVRGDDVVEVRESRVNE